MITDRDHDYYDRWCFRYYSIVAHSPVALGQLGCLAQGAPVRRNAPPSPPARPLPVREPPSSDMFIVITIDMIVDMIICMNVGVILNIMVHMIIDSISASVKLLIIIVASKSSSWFPQPPPSGRRRAGGGGLRACHGPAPAPLRGRRPQAPSSRCAAIKLIMITRMIQYICNNNGQTN